MLKSAYLYNNTSTQMKQCVRRVVGSGSVTVCFSRIEMNLSLVLLFTSVLISGHFSRLMIKMLFTELPIGAKECQICKRDGLFIAH